MIWLAYHWVQRVIWIPTEIINFLHFCIIGRAYWALGTHHLVKELPYVKHFNECINYNKKTSLGSLFPLHNPQPSRYSTVIGFLFPLLHQASPQDAVCPVHLCSSSTDCSVWYKAGIQSGWSRVLSLKFIQHRTIGPSLRSKIQFFLLRFQKHVTLWMHCTGPM